MNIYEYIDKYGDITFNKMKFNEIDNVLFSFLSYSNLEGIVDKDKITIEEAAIKHIEKYPGEDKNIIAVREANKLLRYIKDKSRYKNCLLYNYEYIGNDAIQFGALSIEYQKNKVYVSFEGTDSLFSGWKENFMLSYKFPTKSHKKAIKYLNKHFTFSNDNIIVGGHSKGGNLALVGAMYSNILVRAKIRKVLNADGPGLLDSEYKSNRYKAIKRKYTHIIPNYSLVGLFLNHDKDEVVNSTNKSILAHNIVYWEIDQNSFKKTKLSAFSKELDSEIKKWFNKYNEEDKMFFIINLEDIIRKANINSILDLKKEHGNIIKLIYESKEMSENTKKVLIDFISILIKSFRNVKVEELKSFITTMFKIKKRD